MKFNATKKLSDNRPLRTVMIWMLLTLIAAMGLNLTAKSIDYGTGPEQWVHAVLGNEAEFADPLNFNELLLRVHTDLFALILIFILIAALAVRTSRPLPIKMGFLTLALSALILYPLSLLLTPWLGSGGVVTAAGSFLLFHAVMILGALDILIALLRGKL